MKGILGIPMVNNKKIKDYSILIQTSKGVDEINP